MPEPRGSCPRRKSTAFFDVTGTLRRSIRVRREIDRRTGERTAYAGTDVFYGRMVEFGTVKMPPRPFMRPALDAGGQEAVNAIATNLADGIEREVRNAAPLRQARVIR